VIPLLTFDEACMGYQPKLHKKHKVVERVWNDVSADSRFKYLDAGSGWKS